MDEKLRQIAEGLKDDAFGTNLDDAAFAYREDIKYAITVLLDYPHLGREQQVKLVMDWKDSYTRSGAYKLIAEAMEVYPSIEKVNKEFERARITHKIFKFLSICEEKNNTRDAAQYLKLLASILRLDQEDIGDGAGSIIVNILKHDPDSLGVELPKNYTLKSFMNKIEKEYEHRNNTLDTEYTEVS